MRPRRRWPALLLPLATLAGPQGGAADERLGFRVTEGQPMAIESQELEASEKGGRRTLVFRRNVRVSQGDMRISAATLEATYPADAKQPDRLVARGGVELRQGDQRARCDEAVYDRPREQLVCIGDAEFQDGENRLSGDRIEIDLARETVTVRGGAVLRIEPEPAAGGAAEAAGGGS